MKGDAVSALLAGGAAVLGAELSIPKEMGAYSYLIAARSALG